LPLHRWVHPMPAIVVFDFETTGLNPALGERVIEVGAVLVKSGNICASFQRLVNPGFRVSPFISRFTGISNAMLSRTENSTKVLPEFLAFCGNYPLVAHNARFDCAFLDAELALLGQQRINPCACSLMAARRIVPEAPGYRLAVLAKHCALPVHGSWHRTLADARVTAQLWLFMEQRLRKRYGFRQISFALMAQITRLQRQRVPAWLSSQAARQQAGLFDLEVDV